MKKIGLFVLAAILMASALAESPPAEEQRLRGIVEAGYQDSFALREDGTLWAWGAAEYGRLGVGLGGYVLEPTQVELEHVADVSAGYYHSLFLLEDGSVWGAGCNYDYGQIGDGSAANHLSPVKVLEGARQAEASKDFSAVVMEDGTLRAWGRNDKGQLGIGTQETARTPQQVPLEGVREIALGAAHTLALLEDGTVWAWGDNEYGQLGVEIKDYSAEPVQVPLENIIAVQAGNQHSLALDADGAVWAWGDNGYNQLGISGVRESRAPKIAISGGISQIISGGDSNACINVDGQILVWGDLFGAVPEALEYPKVVSLSLGYWHALGVLEDGSVWGFGSNDYSQISQSGSGMGNSFVTWIDTEFSLGESSQTSTRERGKEKPVSLTVQPAQIECIAAGYGSSFAIDAQGNVWAWGRSDYGQLGFGDEESRVTPEKLELDAPVKQVAAGDYHTLFLLEDGRLFAAGCNSDFGQLGDGTLEDSSVPVFVMEGVQSAFASMDISAALLEDGTVVTWGKNDSGQLGRGEDVSGENPAKVELENVIALVGGDRHMGALTAEGELWTWGDNRYGQLGIGEEVEQACTPVQVSLPSKVVSVGSGMYHMIALTEDGTVWTWGDGEYGQLGNNDFGGQPTPVRVTDLEDVVRVFAGADNSGAELSNGRLCCWGYSFYARPEEVEIQCMDASYNWKEYEMERIVFGYEHNLAMDPQGNLYSMGRNDYGQLGLGDKVDSYYSWGETGLNVKDSEWIAPWEGENSRPEEKGDNAHALCA
ncbi:MAG TPA: hypothetical protein IAB02_00990 [Candidatus Pullichristensenella excrementigallinarum]|uniref:RCC1-like domain-containing protein n=1 Tax=Candidatus Pullichristensenella excrementigallinarum TaxID=2840907 RepID=A0A9D1I9I2_9FIRM|nr:hypothetical protein [Candidatus Pullichristensenella excrementigallinarum]